MYNPRVHISSLPTPLIFIIFAYATTLRMLFKIILLAYN